MILRSLKIVYVLPGGLKATALKTGDGGGFAATNVIIMRAIKILTAGGEACVAPGNQALRLLAGPSARFPHSSERPLMKGLGDDHRGHAHGRPDEKQPQEPADPFLPRDLEDAQGGHEIALRGDKTVSGPHTPSVHAFLWPSAIENIIALPEERRLP